jgi:hypothetical protein
MYVCGDVCICVGVNVCVWEHLGERKPGARKETSSMKGN